MKKQIENLVTRLESEINKTPTSELRNLLTDVNVLLQAMKECQQEHNDKLRLHSVRHNTPRKGTGRYMIFITALCGLLGGVGWYHLGIDVGIFTLLMLIVMFLASIRYNQ